MSKVDSMGIEMTIRQDIRDYINDKLSLLDDYNDYQKYLALSGIAETIDDIGRDVGEELSDLYTSIRLNKIN